MGVINGVDCKIYLNVSVLSTAALRRATPTWVEWKSIRDATLNNTFDEADATSRGSGGFRQSAATLTSIEVTGNAIKDKDDAAYIAAETLALTKGVVDALVLDGLKADSNTDGWRVDVQFFSWSEGQPFEGIATVDWTMKPARTAYAPSVVSGPIT